MTLRIPRLRARPAHAASAQLGYLGCLLPCGERVYACGGTYHKSTILVSDDGALSFRRLAHPSTPGLRRLARLDGRLYVVGEYGMLATSVDHGLTWTRIPVDTSSCLFELQRAPDGVWWIIGDDGVILHSRDGVAWRQLETDWDTRLLTIATLRDRVHILGYDGTLRAWRDGELVPLPLESEHALTQLVETRTGAWVVIGDHGVAFRSEDAGATWRPAIVPVRKSLEALIELPQGLLAVGEDATVLWSIDDGRSWAVAQSAITGYLWSIARFGDGLLIGGDEGAVWTLEVSATETVEVPEPVPFAAADDDEDDDDDDDDDAAAAAAAAPSFASPAEASERWIREGTTFIDGLNAYVRRCYEVGARKAGDEPKETRGDMAPYVLDQLVALNQAGEHRRARELFPPAYEPFDYDVLGQPIDQLAILRDGRTLARVGTDVYELERDRIVPVPDVLVFAQSSDRRYVARCLPDRVDVHDGWDGPRVRSLPALAAAVESAVVAPGGDALLAATDAGIYWITEAGAQRLAPDGDDDRVDYPHAALSPNGRYIALGTKDTAHVLLDRRTGRRSGFDPVSSYPCFAAFHADRPDVVFGSCHALYGSATLAVDLDRLVTSRPDPARVLDRRSWLTAVGSTPTGYILGDRSGYLWATSFAGEQEWYAFVGSTITALDISPDGSRLVAGSYAGIVVELELGTESDPRLLTNGPVRDRARWVFWRGAPPLIW